MFSKQLFLLVACVLAASSFSAMNAGAAQTRPLIIAHRGASHDAPENTLAAFRLAWQQGADGIEGDFRLTADGQIVCMHDADTRRTTGTAKTIAEATLPELQPLDAGSWKDPQFAGERIPTLAEVLQAVPPGKLFYLEIKCGPEIMPPLVEVFSRQNQVKQDQLRIISFHPEVIAAAKQALPQVRAFCLTGHREVRDDQATEGATPPADAFPPAPRFSPSLETILHTLEQTGADGLGSGANMQAVDTDFAAALRQAGHELHVWTVDDPEVAHYFVDLGALSLTTNVPARLRALWPDPQPQGLPQSAAPPAEANAGVPSPAAAGTFPQVGSGCQNPPQVAWPPAPPRRRWFPRLFGWRRW